MGNRVLSDTNPRARKKHQCDECGCAIHPGTSYHRVAQIYDGDFYTWLVCEPCRDISGLVQGDNWEELWPDAYVAWATEVSRDDTDPHQADAQAFMDRMNRP